MRAHVKRLIMFSRPSASHACSTCTTLCMPCTSLLLSARSSSPQANCQDDNLGSRQRRGAGVAYEAISLLRQPNKGRCRRCCAIARQTIDARSDCAANNKHQLKSRQRRTQGRAPLVDYRVHAVWTDRGWAGTAAAAIVPLPACWLRQHYCFWSILSVAAACSSSHLPQLVVWRHYWPAIFYVKYWRVAVATVDAAVQASDH